MKKLIALKDISSFDVQGNLIAVTESKSIIHLFDKSFKTIFTNNIGEDLQEIKISDGYIWTNTSAEGKGVLYQNGRVSICDFYITTIRGNFFYISQNGEDQKLQVPDRIVWVIFDELFTYLLSDAHLVYKKNKYELVLLDDSTGQALWVFNLPETKYDWETKGAYGRAHKGEISKIIGENSGIIWIALNSGRLLGITSSSGEKNYELLFPNISSEDFSNDQGVFLYGLHTKLDKKRCVLFGMVFHYYWETDLRDPENTYICYDISKTCLEHGINFNNLQYQCHVSDEIFFAQNEFAQDPSYVGIFNRDTREVIWTSRELGEEGIFKGVRKVEYSEGRLYVLDRAQTLHVFERGSRG